MINKELSSTMSDKGQRWQELVEWRRHHRGRSTSAGKFLFKRSYHDWKRNWSKSCYCWQVTSSEFTHSSRHSRQLGRRQSKRKILIPFKWTGQKTKGLRKVGKKKELTTKRTMWAFIPSIFGLQRKSFWRWQ